MLRIRAVIVDDELRSQHLLSSLLEKYFPNVSIVGRASSVKEAIEMINITQPSLVFMDVELTPGTGFDILKALSVVKFEIIFVTGFDHYALKAIKFHALDYLLKPIDNEELRLAIRKVEEVLEKSLNSERLEQLLSNLKNPNQNAHKMAIPTSTGKEFIAVEDIIRLEADGGCTWFYLKNNRKIISSTNLGEYEKLLPNPDSVGLHHFIRIHHGHLVNLFYVQNINNREHYVRMEGEEKIYIAQRRKSSFVLALKKLQLI